MREIASRVSNMQFGRSDQFSIETSLMEIHGKWIYGHLRLHLGGISVGDFDDTSDLATSARWARVFLQASPRRTRPDLDHASVAQVFERLYGRFVVPIGDVGELRARRPGASPVTEPWDRDPYLLDNLGESALRDKFAVLVVRRLDAVDRVIVQRYSDDHLFEVLVDEGLVDAAVKDYCNWVEGLRP